MINDYSNAEQNSMLLDWLNHLSDQAQDTPAFEGEVSANYAAILAQYLKAECYLDPQHMLASADISPQDLANNKAKISLDRYARFVNQALEQTQNRHLGLEYGLRLNISTHGLLGYAVMSCPSITKAIELAHKYIKIRNQLIHISYDLAKSGDEFIIRFELSQSDPNLYVFEVDASLSSVYVIMQELFGSTSSISSIHFNYPKPANVSIHDEIFSVPLFFEESFSGIRLKVSELKNHGRMTDATLSKVAEQQCQALYAQLNDDTHKGQNLANTIRQLLLNPHIGFISQEQAAQRLKMTPRTLSRKLVQEGTSFKRILEGIRKELSLKCIEQTQWSVEDIAFILQYSDAANFSRAFKRWFGRSPGIYRKGLNR